MSEAKSPKPAANTSTSISISSGNPASNQSQSPIKLRKAVFTKISDLQPASHGHNLHVRVLSVNTITDKKLADGRRLRLSEALVGDSTGTILLTLRANQIELAPVNTNITIRNAHIQMVRNHMRLSVDQWGLIEPAKPEDSATIGTVNTNNNLSDTEYELVNVD